MRLVLGERILFVAAGVLTGAAFLVPDTAASAVFGWLAVLALLRAATTAARPLSGLFLFGIVLHALGFYWLPHTVTTFGGFSFVLGVLIFVLFCVASSLQYVLVGVLFRLLRRTPLAAVALDFPLAWLTLEMVFVQIFPWRFCHTQIAWGAFAGVAELVGVTTLSALMLWWAGLLVRPGLRRPARFAALLFAVPVLLIGVQRNAQTAAEIETAPAITVGLIQGNLSTERKGDVSFLEANIETYRRLSASAAAAGAELLFWPETVMNVWTPERSVTVRGTHFDPYPEGQLPLVYGTLGFRPRDAQETAVLQQRMGPWLDEDARRALAFQRFNSAFGVDENGRVIGVYHKQILMPFGEYFPLARSLPFLLSLSPQTGDFDAGDLREPLRFQRPDVSVMPLICYEDLLPGPTREGVLRGATLLLNLTNDAWYGRSHAPYQHHLIALWRAIETRRSLVRATNTGFTAVVTPLGETKHGVGLFEEGTLIAKLPLLRRTTLSVKLAERHNWLLIAFAAVFVGVPVVRPGRRS